ncbi:MAG: hypothetical protein IJO45_02330 [Oscillospiraceae bacterium]|nr:hypothetical protein [Oscillospiraceae bacterium]
MQIMLPLSSDIFSGNFGGKVGKFGKTVVFQGAKQTPLTKIFVEYPQSSGGMFFACREILVKAKLYKVIFPFRRTYAGESRDLRCEHRPAEGFASGADGCVAAAGQGRR